VLALGDRRKLRFATLRIESCNAKAQRGLSGLEVYAHERDLDAVSEAKRSKIVGFGMPDGRDPGTRFQGFGQRRSTLLQHLDQEIVAVLEQARVENYTGGIHILEANALLGRNS
jgi:hypothetical protein